YREVNPGLFTIITFPFLFAIMFGDLGHGFLVTLIALYLCLRERELERTLKDEMARLVFDGRYILLLMGLFSIYTGLLYNDLFSRAMWLFESGWKWPATTGNATVEAVFSHVYPIGIDPAWRGAENALIFTNSYKMKMAVILGVTQMTFGIVLSAYNHR